MTQDLVTTNDLYDILYDRLSALLGRYDTVDKPAIAIRQKRENTDVTGLEVIISGRHFDTENKGCCSVKTVWWYVKFYQHEGRYTLDDALDVISDIGYSQEYREAQSDTIMKDKLYGILKITETL